MIEAKDYEYLVKIVGEDFVKTDKETLSLWGKDWTKNLDSDPSCVVFPKTSQEISQVLKYCHSRNIKVVPNGGKTGLSGGAYAQNKELVLSLERLNNILRVDPISRIVETEAGVPTFLLQQEASKHGLFFPIDLASKGSCQIGGNIATNAGGLKFIRFGGTRNHVLGIEVVLADGSILDLNRELRKDNTGYDLKHLFVGSEGTLGIITKATIALVPPPKDPSLLLISLKNPSSLLWFIERLNHTGWSFSALEFFTQLALKKVVKHLSLTEKLPQDAAIYLLVEVEGLDVDSDKFEKFIMDISEYQGVVEGLLASSQQEFKRFWSYRENITESLQINKHVAKSDITVPVRSIAEFIDRVECLSSSSQIEIVLFGHVGDGNVHVNFVAQNMSREEFLSNLSLLQAQVNKILLDLKGSFSAEHGVGLIKRSMLKSFKNPEEIMYMRSLKRLFDPKNILNPDKIFEEQSS